MQGHKDDCDPWSQGNGLEGTEHREMKDKIGQLSFQGDREPVAGSMRDTAHKTNAGEVAVARYRGE
jgi:hypothetical protein